MSQLLIRNLDPNIVERLKNMAKLHHRSLQGEIKIILEKVATIPSDKFSILMEEESIKSWPAGFFEEVVGGWQGEILTRSPQDKYDQRDEFE